MAHIWQEVEPQLPRPTWWLFVQRLIDESDRDRIFVIGASVAYFGFMSLFPMLIALVSVVGLVADPEIVEEKMADVSHLMPPGAAELVLGQLRGIVQTAPTSLGLGLVLSLVGSLWGASSGAASLVKALDIAYEVPEERTYLKTRGVALVVVLGGLLVTLMVAGLMFGLPVLSAHLETFAWLSEYLGWLRWVASAALMAFAMALVYRYAPLRQSARWVGITSGSAVATLLWLGATGLFSLYVNIAGSFQATYGALAGVVVLLFWLYLSAVAILVGAEVDSALSWILRGFKTPDGEDDSLLISGMRGTRHAPRVA